MLTSVQQEFFKYEALEEHQILVVTFFLFRVNFLSSIEFSVFHCPRYSGCSLLFSNTYQALSSCGRRKLAYKFTVSMGCRLRLAYFSL